MKVFQTALLLIIAISTIGIFVQNQMILNRLSLQNIEVTNQLAKKASFTPNQNYAVVPVNKDGSIDVNLKSSTDIIDVNIEQVTGHDVHRKVPVEITE